MPPIKRLAKAFSVGVIVGISAFIVIFVGGLAWESYWYPHDGQAGLGPFIYGLFIAPEAALVTFVVSYHRQKP